MSQATNIGWTDVSWNPVLGCSIKSTECRNCYAETIATKFKLTPLPWLPASAADNVILKPHKLREPLSNAKHWRGLGDAARAAGKTEGKLVFVNSMSDLFHEEVPFEYIDRVFETMVEAEQHSFQILTKRPERMLAYFEHVADYMGLVLGDLVPWPNIWLGVSIGLRSFARRADVLRQVPAAVRFISAEPLLGPLVAHFSEELGDYGQSHGGEWIWPDGRVSDGPGLDLAGIDWLITGGESGPNHRPMDLDWCRDLRDACAVSGTAYFHKQGGGARPGGDRLLDGREWSEFPKAAAHAA